jgi:hypothetical protein
MASDCTPHCVGNTRCGSAAHSAPHVASSCHRNCNHFCYDLAERLAGEWAPENAAFMEEHVLHESEAILNSLPGGTLQQSMTRSVTRQVQKIIIKSWRREWKRALAEYEEQQEIPLAERIS